MSQSTLAHYQELLRQARERILDFGMPVMLRNRFANWEVRRE